MKDRVVGRSELRVSEIGLGCNNFGWRVDAAETQAIVATALDNGITFFDTADIYGRPTRGRSEEYLGRALGKRRGEAVIATKFGVPMDDARESGGASPAYVRAAVEASLRRLNTEYIDLYQLHVPDPATPLHETLQTLDELVKEGKIRYAGCSNFDGWRVADASWTAHVHGTTAFVSNQHQYSLLVRDVERETIPAMEAHGVSLLPFFPLASGLLTGKYRLGQPPPENARLRGDSPLVKRFVSEANLRTVDALIQFCEQRGRTLLELAFSWLLSRSTVASIIAGATSPDQVVANVHAAGWTLSAEDLAEIDRISPPPVSVALV